MGPYVSPILLVLVNIEIGVLLMSNRPGKFIGEKRLRSRAQIGLTLWFVSATALLIQIGILIAKTPLDPSQSDIIPMIQLMAQRFLEGGFAYEPVTNWGYHMPPAYLPFHWGPLVIAEWIGFDPRWIPISIWLIGYGTLLWSLHRLQVPLIAKLIAMILPVLIIQYLIIYDPVVFTLAVEPMVVGYYMILVSGLLSRKLGLALTGVILCVLSRYSLLFWLPIYFLIVWKAVSFRRASQHALILIVAILAIYVLPFMTTDWQIFQKGIAYYVEKSIPFEWHSHWIDAGWRAVPGVLFNGLGLAPYFYDLAGSEASKIDAIRQAAIVTCLLGTSFISAYVLAKRPLDSPFALLAGSLVVCLAAFYSFVPVPHVYLFLVPITLGAISLPILYRPLKLPDQKTT
jgi:hypothetical protein